MHIEDILTQMREGREQSPAALEAFVKGVVDGTVSRPQAAAWLAFAFTRGLTDAETVALTQSMTRSGTVMRWEPGPELVDKHSTGGVGDKVSLVLAPVWAALGKRVPMISGRGLGHTGGTLDKLEAVPGFRTDLDDARLQQVLGSVGCFISGQTSSLAPADRVLYALRNETSTVPSIPLIVGSILSKKLAEGVERLVLDVKTGSGAFMKEPEQAAALADTLVRVATGAGLSCTALVTAMDRPLGRAIGNAVEVAEAIACLSGQGPADLRELTCVLSGDPEVAARVLDDGSALAVFTRMLEAQGGDARVVDRPALLLGGGVQEEVLRARRAGIVQYAHALPLGRAAFNLGAGRRRAEDAVDFGVGLRMHVAPGDRVEPGQPLVTLLHRDGHAVQEAAALCREAIVLGDVEVRIPPLVQRRVG